MNGVSKIRPGFKNFSIKLHDLAYSPALKHKIGTKRKRLLHQKKNHSGSEQKRMKLTDGTDKRRVSLESSPITQKEVTVVSKQQEVKLCQLEECWKTRTPFIEKFDLNHYNDSRDAARMLLKWLIYPVDCDKFLKYCAVLSFVCKTFRLCAPLHLGSSGKESHCCSNAIDHIIIMVYLVQLN